MSLEVAIIKGFFLGLLYTYVLPNDK